MISINEIRHIFNLTDKQALENLAEKAQKLTQQYFGRTVSLYAPLYLSNYCSSRCLYCGFSSQNRLKRFKLTPEQIRQEMGFLSRVGIESILLLTGESYHTTDLEYLIQAVRLAKEFFPHISLEVHPMETEEYKKLFNEGADGLTIYQETYNRPRYKQLHLSGKKADYDYRRQTPTRAAQAGFRQISLGILLGLSDPTEDILALYHHLAEMEKEFPGVEYSLSFPRLQAIKGQAFPSIAIPDEMLIKIICLTRILFPRVGINLSTRENFRLRDHAIELGVTRLSAASKTSVGGYTFAAAETQDPQFDVQDTRSVDDIVAMLKRRQFDPVFTEWRRI